MTCILCKLHVLLNQYIWFHVLVICSENLSHKTLLVLSRLLYHSKLKTDMDEFKKYRNSIQQYLFILFWTIHRYIHLVLCTRNSLISAPFYTRLKLGQNCHNHWPLSNKLDKDNFRFFYFIWTILNYALFTAKK